jgi:hypothetical protein
VNKMCVTEGTEPTMTEVRYRNDRHREIVPLACAQGPLARSERTI